MATTKEDFICCRICNKRMKLLGYKHLESHNLSMHEYRLLYPNDRLSVRKTSIIRNCTYCNKPVSGKKMHAKRAFCNLECYWQWKNGVSYNDLFNSKTLANKIRSKKSKNMLGKNLGKPSWIKGKTYAEVYTPDVINYKTQKTREANTSRRHTKKQNKNHSSVVKKLWKTPDYLRKQMKARNWGVINKTEYKLLMLLDQLFPNEYKFTGDGSLILDGRIPDFCNINGQKKIIELYGDYWHRNDDPKDRIALFKPFGYKTLVIWEHELKDLVSLKQTLIDFHKD